MSSLRHKRIKRHPLLFIVGAAFLLGCSATLQKPQVVQEPLLMKCQVPEAPRAELQAIPENATYPEKLQIILNNYLKIQKENELLRSALEVCK